LQKPFVGRAGKLLDSLLKFINLDRSTVYITNVVNYRPDKNRKPTLKEINKFRKFLFKHIEIIKPKFILLLGRTAARAVLSHKGLLSQVIGKVYKKKIIKSYFDIFVIFHPAFLLRQPHQIKIVFKSLTKFKKKLIVL